MVETKYGVAFEEIYHRGSMQLPIGKVESYKES